MIIIIIIIIIVVVVKKKEKEKEKEVEVGRQSCIRRVVLTSCELSELRVDRVI